MIKNFFSFFLLISKCRFKFKKPKKVEILLYDQGLFFNQEFIQSFKENNIEIIYSRLEEINLYVLFISFLKFNSLSKRKFFLNYLITYCNIVKPSWIVTSNHYDLKFYDLKKNINLDVKFAIIQGVPIFEFHIKNFFSSALTDNKKLHIDYFFCFDEFTIKILKNYIDTNFVIIGSFRNNCYPIKNTETNEDILVISGLKEKPIDMSNRKKYQTDIDQENKLLQLLILISEKQNLNFKILLKPLTKISEYSKFMGISENYCIFNNGFNNYHTVDKFHLLIFPNDSTLRFEAVSRDKNFCFTQPNYQLDREKMNSSCVLKTDLNYDNLINLINTTMNQDNKTFKSKNINLNKPILFDANNHILKSFIKIKKNSLYDY